MKKKLLLAVFTIFTLTILVGCKDDEVSWSDAKTRYEAASVEITDYLPSVLVADDSTTLSYSPEEIDAMSSTELIALSLIVWTLDIVLDLVDTELRAMYEKGENYSGTYTDTTFVESTLVISDINNGFKFEQTIADGDDTFTTVTEVTFTSSFVNISMSYQDDEEKGSFIVTENEITYSSESIDGSTYSKYELKKMNSSTNYVFIEDMSTINGVQETNTVYTEGDSNNAYIISNDSQNSTQSISYFNSEAEVMFNYSIVNDSHEFMYDMKSVAGWDTISPSSSTFTLSNDGTNIASTNDYAFVYTTAALFISESYTIKLEGSSYESVKSLFDLSSGISGLSFALSSTEIDNIITTAQAVIA